MDQISEICNQFLPGKIVQNIIPYGSGHINDTYKVETRTKNYLLQRINHEIFRNVESLTNNIIKITTHIGHKLNRNKSSMQSLNLRKTSGGDFLIKDDLDNIWRLLDFVEDSFSYDLVENPELAYEGGKAYGWFVNMLDDFPVNDLVETIPDFHNAKFRIGNFRDAVKNDTVHRSKYVKTEIHALENRAEEMMHIYNLGQDGRIPLRVTHNDTKINNVLFNKNSKGICVIDLDTVMPGFVHYDFGDSVRTFTNTANEDEAELDKVSMNLELFKRYSEGFLLQTKKLLNHVEIDNLAFSAKYITYEQAIRFLTDYLHGDTYYKTKYPEHNLQRTKVQLKLLDSMEENYEKMQEIIAAQFDN